MWASVRSCHPTLIAIETTSSELEVHELSPISMKLSSSVLFVCLGCSAALRHGRPVLNRPLPCRRGPRMAIELPQYAPTIEASIAK
eukprot:scaffold36377_cov66-Phaeocystis_antarctica.AAC.8